MPQSQLSDLQIINSHMVSLGSLSFQGSARDYQSLPVTFLGAPSHRCPDLLHCVRIILHFTAAFWSYYSFPRLTYLPSSQAKQKKTASWPEPKKMLWLINLATHFIHRWQYWLMSKIRMSDSSLTPAFQNKQIHLYSHPQNNHRMLGWT